MTGVFNKINEFIQSLIHQINYNPPYIPPFDFLVVNFWFQTEGLLFPRVEIL